jgi:cyclopropane-fatty-acyl-phospholipid synthase
MFMERVDTLSRTLLLSRWDAILKDARLVIREGGSTQVIGRTDDAPGVQVVEMAVHRPRAFRRILTLGTLGLGESYMDGDFDLPVGGMEGLFAALVRNRGNHKSRFDPIFAAQYAEILVRNRFARTPAEVVQSHYDIGQDLYEAFLDTRMVYTCGYAKTPDDDLDTMQAQKLDRICRKLRLKPDETMLDLGCGYGSLLIYAAKNYGIRGVGITISKDHHAEACRRAQAEGLTGRLDFRFGDYAGISGTFDKVSSIGIMEHIRESDYGKFIGTYARTLKKGGLAMIHTIGWGGPKNRHDPFVQKYLFPGTNQPRLAQIVRQCEKKGLLVLDVENMARHYYYTVKHWQQNFNANRHRLDPKRYDERFVRMWDVYMSWGLAISRYSEGALFQVLVTNDPTMDHPLVRV